MRRNIINIYSVYFGALETNGFISDCQDLIAPLYGSLSSNRVSHGKIVKVSCIKGYTLSGERTILCTSGTWSSSIGTCEAGIAHSLLLCTVFHTIL